MFAKINHLAIVSENYSQLGKFYEAVFGMKMGSSRPGRAITVGDGYVGLNINPRREGRQARLDHFGIQVEDVDTAFKRMRAHYPRVKWLQRPSTRPFAGLTTHDPDGNVFDLSQKDMKNRTSLYAEEGWSQPRTLSHIAIRTMNAEAMAQFYSDVFELAVLNKTEGDPNFYVSDGRITIELIQWDIESSAGVSVIMPGIDHLGFKVESIEKLKEDVEALSANPYMRPMGIGIGSEGVTRVKIFRDCCPFGTYHMADTDGILIDVSE
jgi:catechol 2,3-dioxygenase-like lactoylglutathione lyase family enzyme